MARPKYLRIPEAAWKKYQQKERPDGWQPPWLKLWNKTIDNFDLRTLPMDIRFVYVGLLIIANETNNLIPASHEWLHERLTGPTKTIEKAVNVLVAKGLVERCSARNVETVSKSLRNDRSRVRQKAEERRKRGSGSPRSEVRSESNGLPDITNELEAILACCKDADSRSILTLKAAASGLSLGSLVKVRESCKHYRGRIGVGYAVNALRSEKHERGVAA